MNRYYLVLLAILSAPALISCDEPPLPPALSTPTPIFPFPLSPRIVDSFGSPNCSPYRTETAQELLAYCAYYADAQVGLTPVSLAEGEKGVQLSYTLPPTFDWGNWLSIRQESGNLMDLSTYAGLSLRFRIEMPAATRLRMTLADVDSPLDANVKGADELWWCDLGRIEDSMVGEWQTVTCPFADFELAAGAGTRLNNLRLDLKYIVAYELNIVSDAGVNASGIIVLDSLIAFR